MNADPSVLSSSGIFSSPKKQCWRSGSGSESACFRILPFSHKGVERTEIMRTQKMLAKNLIFKTEDNVPVGKL